MRLHRFYVLQPLGEEVVIESISTIKQMYNVFRYKEGDLVILFNGKGLDVIYKITSISSSMCRLVEIEKHTSISVNKNLTLYISIVKKDNVELIVQKVTELGISRIVPIISERSEKKGLNKDRLEKIATEASEQCGRGDIPIIDDIKSFDEALSSINSESISIFAQMDGIEINEKVLQDRLISAKKNKGEINLWIGPEGGWSEKEIEKFKKEKMIGISLGKNVLRTETAAIVASAFLL